jgi:L-glutamine-phosphate cytidylyltransferase
MRALILAAGRGSRMKGLTDDRPKCLVELAGRSLLDYQMTALREGGAVEIGLVTGYRSEVLEEFGLPLFRNNRWFETNMVVSLSCASEWLRSEPCLVSYGDIFYSSETVKRLREAPGEIAISYDPDWFQLWSARFNDPLSDAETFALNPDGTVRDIGRKPTALAEIQGQYMGLLKINPESWARIQRFLGSIGQDQADRLDMTGLLRALIQDGLALNAIPVVGGWGEIDSAEDLALYGGR